MTGVSSITSTRNPIKASSAVPPSDAIWDALGLLVTVEVVDSDIEHPQISRNYEIQPAGGTFDVLIWMVTNPNHPKNRLTQMRDHRKWYVRETSRHPHTKDGLAFRRLVADQPLCDIPSCNGTRTVYAVQSDTPYMVLAMGDAIWQITSTSNWWKVHVNHSITASEQRRWVDLPREQVKDYSADKLVGGATSYSMILWI
ncbi:hypothetical protein FRB94_011427 [Tulasnella sp. JGI-2019a]|nr:hypothetical protein FRB93_003244 [Tulasnella sp. JGI-2019a]KAG8992586.1 hypothetical protein FRB94_011427 [Tulasnella sp. JGI-2019a]